jgi:hypothetical protein
MKIMKMASVWRKRKLKSGVSAYQQWRRQLAKINNGGNGAGNNGGVMAAKIIIYAKK